MSLPFHKSKIVFSIWYYSYQALMRVSQEFSSEKSKKLRSLNTILMKITKSVRSSQCLLRMQIFLVCMSWNDENVALMFHF